MAESRDENVIGCECPNCAAARDLAATLGPQIDGMDPQIIINALAMLMADVLRAWDGKPDPDTPEALPERLEFFQGLASAIVNNSYRIDKHEADGCNRRH